VGLANRANERAVNLSGGELQRVCIARAIAAQPRCILADEPTGQLDRSTSTQVLDALWAVLDSHTALVVATHDPIVAARCDDIATISDGRITVSGA
jgi:putative ABC transport system ATP-binding protein